MMSTKRLSGWLFATGIVAVLLSPQLRAAPGEAFGVSVAPVSATNPAALKVTFEVAPGCVLYAERLHFLTADRNELAPHDMPAPLEEWDKASARMKKVYEQSFSATLYAGTQALSRLVIKLQGCTNGACFAPEERTFERQAAGGFVRVADEGDDSATAAYGAVDWTNALKDFKVVAQQTGYLKPSAFSAFLDRSASGKSDGSDTLDRFAGLGLGTTLLLIVIGGFLLNFTPCVLPMIPINLAVIGAGAKAQTRAEGLRKGGVYGAGMALAYGVLGLVVVLTGAKFGALNSSFWFNAVITLLFLVMGLAMFDLLHIDFSRFSSRASPRKSQSQRGSLLVYLGIFGMGAVAALLAGACVAPVVVSALLLAASLYAKGLVAGLLLPFLLGLGMALPWPVAGAGLAVLPKPGNWMNYVKRGFGVMIFALALYYGHLAYDLLGVTRLGGTPLIAAASSGGADANSAADQADQEFLQALQRSKQEGLPVFVDFHASWCKNCLAMDATVFNRADVQARLRKFIVVRYATEQPNRSPAKQLLDHFGVMGLPSYVVVATRKTAGAGNSLQ